MFDILGARTLSIFEQVNQRHVVQEIHIKDVLEQEVKMKDSEDAILAAAAISPPANYNDHSLQDHLAIH